VPGLGEFNGYYLKMSYPNLMKTLTSLHSAPSSINKTRFNPVRHYEGINLNTEFADRHSWDATAVDCAHLKETEGFQLAESPEQVRLRTVRQLRQFSDRLRFGVPDRPQENPIIWCQETQQHLSGLDTWLRGIRRRRGLSARRRPHVRE